MKKMAVSFSILFAFLAIKETTYTMEEYLHASTQALAEAIQDNNLEAAKEALAKRANPNALIRMAGYTIDLSFLEAAALKGNLPMVKLLISKGAVLGGKDLIHFAVRSNNVELVRWLVGEGLDVPSLISDALDLRNKEMLELLLKEGASVAGSLNLVVDAVLHKLAPGETEESVIPFVEFALNHGYDINGASYNMRAISSLIDKRYYKLISWFVEHGALLITGSVQHDLAVQDIKSIFTEPLLDAIAFHKADEALQILGTLKGMLGRSKIALINQALILAAAQGLDKVVEALLDIFNNHLSISSIGTALERAALNGHADTFEMLYNARVGSIQHNPIDWEPYLERAFFWAAVHAPNPQVARQYYVQDFPRIVEFILTQNYLYDLRIPLDRTAQQVRTLLASAGISSETKKKLESLLKLLASHQSVAASHQAAERETSLLSTLPKEILEKVLKSVAPSSGFGFSSH